MTNTINMSNITKRKQRIHTWEVWLNGDGMVIAISDSKAANKNNKIYKFKHEPDKVLYLTNKSHKVYAYTRPIEMVSFMNKFNIDKVQAAHVNDLCLKISEFTDDIKNKSIEIYTDGVITDIKNYRKTINKNYYECEGKVTVSDFKWIAYRKIYNDSSFTVLYIQEGYDMYTLNIQTETPINLK